MRRRSLLLLAALLGFVAAVATGAAIAVGAGSTGQITATPTTIATSPPAQRFDVALAAELDVTAEPAVSVPDDLVSLSSRITGANPHAARVARSDANGGTVYVMPSTDGLCLTSTSGVEAGCFTSPEVSAGSVICAPGLPVDAVEVFGIAPNATRELTVNLADGSREDIPVRGNVFIYQAPKAKARPLTLSWTDETGRRESVSANVPADFRDGACATPDDNVAPAEGARDQTAPPILGTVK